MIKPVLLTRAEGNETDLDALRSQGLSGVVDPYIEIITSSDPTDATRLVEVVQSSSTPTWIVATSANALTSWAKLVGESALTHLLRTQENLRFAAVGPSTAQVLTAWGVGKILIPETASAAGLSALLRAESAGCVVIPGGSRALGTVPDQLRQAGWEVHTGVVYETRAIAPLPRSMTPTICQDFSAVIFRSPSAVTAFVDGLEQLHIPITDTETLLFMCAGETTARAALDAGLHVASVSSSPSADAIADALSQLLQEKS